MVQLIWIVTISLGLTYIASLGENTTDSGTLCIITNNCYADLCLRVATWLWMTLTVLSLIPLLGRGLSIRPTPPPVSSSAPQSTVIRSVGMDKLVSLDKVLTY